MLFYSTYGGIFLPVGLQSIIANLPGFKYSAYSDSESWTGLLGATSNFDYDSLSNLRKVT